jgi:hypothetical protein
MARAGVPTVMMFVQSLYGISHTKIEDTKEEHIEAAVIAFDRLAEKTMQRIERSNRRADEKRRPKVISERKAEDQQFVEALVSSACGFIARPDCDCRLVNLSSLHSKLAERAPSSPTRRREDRTPRRTSNRVSASRSIFAICLD